MVKEDSYEIFCPVDLIFCCFVSDFNVYRECHFLGLLPVTRF